FLARYFRLQIADDQGRESAADPSGQKRGYDGADVKAGADGRATDTEDRVQNLPANATSEGARDGIAERTQVDILSNISDGVTTECASEELYDERCKVHSESPTKFRTHLMSAPEV